MNEWLASTTLRHIDVRRKMLERTQDIGVRFDTPKYGRRFSRNIDDESVTGQRFAGDRCMLCALEYDRLGAGIDEGNVFVTSQLGGELRAVEVEVVNEVVEPTAIPI